MVTTLRKNILLSYVILCLPAVMLVPTRSIVTINLAFSKVFVGVLRGCLAPTPALGALEIHTEIQ